MQCKGSSRGDRPAGSGVDRPTRGAWPSRGRSATGPRRASWASRRLVCLLALAALSACGVPREQARRPREYDLASVLHLRRAAEALQDRALEEREHVEALNLQLARMRAEEDRVHGEYLAAERDYQLRQADLAGVETDLLLADEDLREQREELQTLQAERAAIEAQLATVRAELVRAEQELAALRARAVEVLDLMGRLRALLAGGSEAELSALLERLPALQAWAAAAPSTELSPEDGAAQPATEAAPESAPEAGPEGAPESAADPAPPESPEGGSEDADDSADPEPEDSGTSAPEAGASMRALS